MRRLLLVLLVALTLPASALAWGGVYPTGDSLGTSLRIEVSDSYPVDETLPQGWATYFGTLVHGPELAGVTLHLLPLSALQRRCGREALACYDPVGATIYTSPEEQLGGPSAQEVATHEYGHHIAATRLDSPWTALDYGTKRWSSYENICAKALLGEASPGDEGSNYSQNSGEAFAEAYRVLNLTKQGATEIGWDIVDEAFYPDATALALLEQDVATPWLRNTVSKLRGSFGNGGVRTFGVKTQLDGTFTARLIAPTKAKMRLALYSGSTLLARGTRVTYEICGQRSLTLKVERLSGRGSFTVDVSKP